MKDQITLGQAFRLLGLKEVTYDPWGNGQAYLQWLSRLKPDSIAQDKLGFWIHIRTCGTMYFAWTYWARAKEHLDFQSMPGKVIWFFIQTRNLIEGYIYTRLMSKEERGRYYRLDYTQPLPDGYVGDLWMRERPPLKCLLSDTMHIVIGRLADEEYSRRKGEHPEIADVLDYIIADSDWLQQEISTRLPGSPIPDKKTALNSLWDYAKRTMKGQIDVKQIEYAYNWDDMDGDRAESIIKELKEAGSDNSLASLKLDSIIASALDGKLGGYLNQVTMHDVTDIVRRIRKRTKKEVLETDKDAERKLDSEVRGEEVDSTPFLDTIPSQEPMPEEPIDLERLGFDIDKLTPKEVLFLEELRDMADKGYERHSKRGLSPRQYWGKDYERKMKMLERLETKRKKL